VAGPHWSPLRDETLARLVGTAVGPAAHWHHLCDAARDVVAIYTGDVQRPAADPAKIPPPPTMHAGARAGQTEPRN